MYQVKITNQDKAVTKGEFLSFSIVGFPPNTDLTFFFSDCKKFQPLEEGDIKSDCNGNGSYAFIFNAVAGKYRLYVRNQAYGTAYQDFNVVEPEAIIS